MTKKKTLSYNDHFVNLFNFLLKASRIASMGGGNAQKTAMARWVDTKQPKYLYEIIIMLFSSFIYIHYFRERNNAKAEAQKNAGGGKSGMEQRRGGDMASAMAAAQGNFSVIHQFVLISQNPFSNRQYLLLLLIFTLLIEYSRTRSYQEEERRKKCQEVDMILSIICSISLPLLLPTFFLYSVIILFA